MENYKLTTTHNVFNTSSGHNSQRKEDYLRQRIVNSPLKKMPDYHKMSVSELKVCMKFFFLENIYLKLFNLNYFLFDLKVQVAKYGVKPLSKAAMIHQLVLIWNYLHQN